ncbi:MAG: MAC/perforin domain-containing protein [Bacteroidia bacterium]|nr:MAC/perforin domain-containing protein [Bacteroidia bacterium]
MKTTKATEKTLTQSRFFLDWTKAELGTGYRLLDYEFTSNMAITEESLQTAMEEKSNPKSNEFEFEIKVFKSEEEMIQQLDLEASAKAAAWGAQMQGKASWFKKNRFSKTSLVVMISVKQVLGTKNLAIDHLNLKKEALEKMKDSFEKFYEKYGSHFVGMIEYGGELNLFAKTEFTTEKSQQEASASIKASAKKVEGEGKFSSAFSKELQSYGLHLTGYGKGGSLEGMNPSASADEWNKWMFNTWIKTIEEKPAILRSELRELASIDNALDNYKQELRRPIYHTNLLVNSLSAYEKVNRDLIYLIEDGEKFIPAPSVLDQIKGEQQKAKLAIDALKEYRVCETSALNREKPEVVLKGHAKPEELEDTFKKFYKNVKNNRPIRERDPFYLQSTGREGSYFFGAPVGNLGGDEIMLANSNHKSSAIAIEFRGEVKHGGRVNICLAHPIKGKQYLTIGSIGNWIRVKKKAGQKGSWIISKKNQDDEHIRYGDRIRIVNPEQQNLTIKRAKDWGKFYLTAKTHQNHFILIHKI